MMVDVAMKDGRTTFRFAKRSLAVRAMKRAPLELDSDENRSVRCWARWQTGNEWTPARVQLLNPSSIAFVVQVPPEQAAGFLSEFGDERDRAETPA